MAEEERYGQYTTCESCGKGFAIGARQTRAQASQSAAKPSDPAEIPPEGACLKARVKYWFWKMAICLIFVFVIGLSPYLSKAARTACRLTIGQEGLAVAWCISLLIFLRFLPFALDLFAANAAHVQASAVRREQIRLLIFGGISKFHSLQFCPSCKSCKPCRKSLAKPVSPAPIMPYTLRLGVCARIFLNC